MNKVVIIVDSTCDLPKDLIEQKNIVIFTKYVAIYLYKCYNSKLRVCVKSRHQRRHFEYGISGKYPQYCHHRPRRSW